MLSAVNDDGITPEGSPIDEIVRESARRTGRPAHGMLHHVELWVPDIHRALASLGWLLEALGYVAFQNWDSGRSWRLGPTYLVIEQSPALTAHQHDRCRPGLNHLAFHVEDAAAVDKLTADAAHHGWHLLFPDQHPYAGGRQHYAAYLENDDGFEVELVAIMPPDRTGVGTDAHANVTP